MFVGSPYDDAFMITFNDTTSDRKGEILDQEQTAAPLLAYATFAVSSKETLQQWMSLLMPIKAGKSGTDMFKQVAKSSPFAQFCPSASRTRPFFNTQSATHQLVICSSRANLFFYFLFLWK